MRRLFVLFFLAGAFGMEILQGNGDKSPPVGSNPDRSISWWVSASDSDGVSSLRHTLMRVKSLKDGQKYPLLASLKSIYLCCNIFNISRTTGQKPQTFVDKKFDNSYLRKTIESYRRAFPSVNVIAHVKASYEPMVIFGAATSNRSKIVASLASMANDVGLDGITVDYEPQRHFTRGHAHIYGMFLDELGSAMKNYGMKLGTFVSDWGILKHYDIYGMSNVDTIGSMASTYYGDDLKSNRDNVKSMMKSISNEKLEVGVGIMHTDGTVKIPKRVYKWDRSGLRKFLRWLNNQGITRLHVWPGKWKAHRLSETYYLKTLAQF